MNEADDSPTNKAEVTAAVACPTCSSAAGTQCYFDAFERLGSDGKMRARDGDIHQARAVAWDNQAVRIGIEIVTRRRYAIHARTEESALEMIQLFEHDLHPTIINDTSCGGARAFALDRQQSLIERISLEAEDPTHDDPVRDLLDSFFDLSMGQQREVIDRITHEFTDDGSP